MNISDKYREMVLDSIKDARRLVFRTLKSDLKLCEEVLNRRFETLFTNEMMLEAHKILKEAKK